MNLPAIRKIKDMGFGPEDTLVIFGEFFKEGYVSGLIRQAQKKGMNIVYSTVGRRDSEGTLKSPLSEELYFPPQSQKSKTLKPSQKGWADKSSFFIDVPLEAGFDMEPADSGKRPIDLCQSIKLNEWESAILDKNMLEDSRTKARISFEKRVQEWAGRLEKLLPESGNILIAHTMAGGVPRSKIFMPVLNRVLKGRGKRFFSSEVFWQSDLGQLCAKNFHEVTAETYRTLIKATHALREKRHKKNSTVFYTAYSYHGTEVLMGETYKWQSYSPYLQGFAKLQLENISKDFFAKGIKTCVFNVPEILTRSSSVFPGVEIPLYTLLGALKREGEKKGQAIVDTCRTKMKEGAFDFIMQSTKKYFVSPAVQKNTQFEKWPQHNSLEQMEQMLALSKTLFACHKEGEQSITPFLSEQVFASSGRLIFQEISRPSGPLCYLGHDIIARDIAQRG